MQPPSGAPRRLIGLVDATALVVGSMIASGIFIVSAESARLVGTPDRLLAVWVLAGALTLLAAVAVAFAKFLGILAPSLGGGATKTVAASVVLALTATNALGLGAWMAAILSLAATVVILLAIASPRTTLPGFGLVFLGIPVFFARRKGHAG